METCGICEREVEREQTRIDHDALVRVCFDCYLIHVLPTSPHLDPEDKELI